MRTKGGLDEEKQIDLQDGELAASDVLHRANEAIHKEQRLEAVGELLSRVEDWKGHNIDHFGELMLYGSHTVLKGEGQKEVEREVRIIFYPLNSLGHLLERFACINLPLFVSSYFSGWIARPKGKPETLDIHFELGSQKATALCTTNYTK